jgi:transposase-like protein
MNPQQVFCPNLACPARGRVGTGHIGLHQREEQRYICHVCHQSFTATKGTMFHGLKTEAATVLLVVTLLAYGCPVPAIVKAFGFDERTVKQWWQRAGAHCQAVHEQVVERAQLELGQVQADELKVKTQGGILWMALVMMVPTRLWLGGALSPQRDKVLIGQIAGKVRQIALCRPLLIAVDGLVSYVAAFQKALRSPVPRPGRYGRPALRPWPAIAIVQVVKQRRPDGLVIQRRIVQGSQALVNHLFHLTQPGGVINTAYIERLNATFRQRLVWLTRRTRCLAQQATTLTAGMYVVGCFYNFCEVHQSLRVKLWVGSRTYRWVQRTPAIATGLSDHVWSPSELFWFKLPPPPWQPPKRRGRPSKATLALIQRWSL